MREASEKLDVEPSIGDAMITDTFLTTIAAFNIPVAPNHPRG